MTYPTSGTTKTGEGKELPLPAVAIERPKIRRQRRNHLDFSRPTSRAYVQELIEREYRTERLEDRTAQPDSGERPSRWPLHEDDPGPLEELRHSSKLASTKPEDAAEKNRQMALVAKMLDSAKRSFDATPEPERLEVFDSQLAQETRTQGVGCDSPELDRDPPVPLVPVRQLDVRPGRRPVSGPRPVLHARGHRRLPLPAPAPGAELPGH